jgi:hypothetical protein
VGLDELPTRWDFRERHAPVAAARPDAVLAAVRDVGVAELRLGLRACSRLQFRAGSGAAPHGILGAVARRAGAA